MNGRSVLIEDAAALLGVSRRTVYYWIRNGRLETVRTRGGSQRVLMQSIARALDEGRRQRLRISRAATDGACRAVGTLTVASVTASSPS